MPVIKQTCDDRGSDETRRPSYEHGCIRRDDQGFRRNRHHESVPFQFSIAKPLAGGLACGKRSLSAADVSRQLRLSKHAADEPTLPTRLCQRAWGTRPKRFFQSIFESRTVSALYVVACAQCSIGVLALMPNGYCL